MTLVFPELARRHVNAAIGLALVALLHLLIFALPVDWILPELPSRTEVTTLDHSQLEALKRQWEKQTAGRRNLFVPSANTPAPTSETADPRSRYESDRNRQYTTQMRARQGSATIGAGALSRGEDTPASEAQKSRQTLAKLGLKLPTPSAKRGSQQGQEGAIGQTRDRVGSEQLLDEKIATGAFNAINTVESKQYGFYSRIFHAIMPNIESRARTVFAQIQPRPGRYLTQFEFEIDADGTVLGVRVTQSSGLAAFDDLAEYAVRKAGRFPNPPADLQKKGRATILWGYYADIGEGSYPGDFPPPQAPRDRSRPPW